MANPNPYQARQAAIKVNQQLVTHPVTGETLNLSQWARKLGLTTNGLRYRLKRMELADALDAPVRSNARGWLNAG